jgi:hypothetical protein
MKVTPIANPLPDEHLTAISPTLAPDVHEYWNRRLNLYPGRALSDTALTMEQNSRAGRLATHGQCLSAGVVSGLEVALERETAARRSRSFYHIAAGTGVAASGEDVVLPQSVRVNVLDVEVCAPAFAFHGSPSAARIRPYSGTLLPRLIGAPLGKVIEERERAKRRDDETLPRVGILLLQPVTLEIVGDANATDPCEEDPDNYSFEDWQLVDGCRLLWYAWPTEWRPLPTGDLLRRNRLAYAIFEAERQLSPDELLPWESFGVPLGVVAFNRQWKPLFFDRPAVVRAGGKPKRRATALNNLGHAFLWQARVEQFAAQVADSDLVNAPPESLAKQFRFIPPAGLLPKPLIQPRAGYDKFFPASYRVEAFPVPVEQLDAALESSAPLAPFDLSTADEVQVLVPVPQQWYEPNLLKVERVDPVFIATIDHHARRRRKLLARRMQVRDRAAGVDVAMGRTPVAWPDPDPRALEREWDPVRDPLPDPIDEGDDFLKAPELDFGVDLKSDDTILTIGTNLPRVTDGKLSGEPPTLVDTHASVRALETLRAYLRNSSPVMRTYTQVLAAPAAGLKLPDDVAAHPEWELASRVRYDVDTNVLSFRGPMSVLDHEHLKGLNGSAAYKDALRALLLQSQDDDLARFDPLGLSGFITMLEQKVNEADDKVDLAFARVQTDIYRLRQHMLGTDAATRLATSPVLASIAKGDSAAATRDTLKSFVSDMKTQAPGTLPLETGFLQPTAPARTPKATGGVVPPPAPSAVVEAPAAPVFSASLLGIRAPVVSSPVLLGGGIRFNFSAFSPAATLERTATPTELSRTMTGIRPSALPVIATARNEVVEQSPIIGKAMDFRTVTLAERLEQPKAAEAKNYAVSTKADVLSTLAALKINIDDLEVPGFYQYKKKDAQTIELEADRIFDKPEGVEGRRVVRLVPKERTHTFLDVKTFSLANEVVQGKHDIDPLNGDESAFFAAAVRSLDHVVAFLRVVEGRIQAYRMTIGRCRETLAELGTQRSEIDSRLAVIEGELTETRNDVAVARALLADEITRVNKINARRDHVVDTHGRFFAYRRPRMLDLLDHAPSRPLDPAYTESALPMCLSRRVVPPVELTHVVNLLKDVPLRWLRALPSLLSHLDRVEVMQEAMQHAKIRAAVQYQTQLLMQKPPERAGTIGDSIRKVLGAQRDLVTHFRIVTAQLDLAEFAAQTWQRIREHAVDILSPGDLADGSHGRADVTHACAEELRNIAHVAGCLYADFGQVLPSLRLQWAEQLGQYDDTVNLRNLAALPRWGEIDYLERREMQGMVDWLFGRLDPSVPEAAKLMNDVVRIAVLLASHAPVNEIVAGDVQQTATVSEGEQVELAADLEKVRVGMHVLMYAKPEKDDDPPKVIARAVVQDIGAGKVAAVIVQTSQPTVSIPAAAKAHFVSEDHPAVAAAHEKQQERELGERSGGPKAGPLARLGKVYR